MQMDIFRLSDGFNALFETNMLPEAHKFDIHLAPDREKYVISIDPGTTSVGMIIGDVVSRVPLYWLNVQRGKAGSLEENQDTFVTNFLIFLRNTIESCERVNGVNKYKYLKIERPFVDKKKNYDTYVALKKMLDGCVNIAKHLGLAVYTTPPKSWEAWYLGPVKQEWDLNLNKSNKAAIKRRGMEKLNQIYSMIIDENVKANYISFFMKNGARGYKSDTFDANGLFEHFMAVDYSENDIVRVNTAMARTNRDVNVAIYAYREKATQTEKTSVEVIEYTKSLLERLSGDKITVQQFNYCNLMTAEDNIRAVVEHCGDRCLAMSVTDLTISLFPELYDNVNFKVSNLTPKSLILILGYKSR